ncbi:MAG: error-prone DNA polymerase [Acetobacteraceae bacterium]|nr:error-prone DNA polymerase [Acetobacteraceae bacterium]
MTYAELQVTTNYSFLRGASHPEELFAQAAAYGISALGIVDHNSVAGIVRCWEAAKTTGIRLVAGCRLALRDGTVLLAYPTDRPAWSRLCRLLTEGKRRTGKGGCDIGWDDLAAGGDGLLYILVPEQPDARLQAQLARLAADAPSRAYLAGTIRRRPGDQTRLHRLATLAAAARIPLIATGDVLFHRPERRVLQDVMACIREGCTIDAAGFRRERFADRHLKPPEEMARLFARHPDAIARTEELVARCHFDLSDLRYQYPDEQEEPGLSPQQTLERLTWEGAARRYGGTVPAPVAQQLQHELRLIDGLGYAPYFLTVNSIVRYARSEGILCQGRGSAANSAVCYVLGITSIDPTQSGLLFERFVSAERAEPPDIDVDFEHEQRERVIQWIYQHYGRDRAALCATVIRYRARGAMREVGKVLGLTEDVTGALSSQVWGWSEEGVEEKHAEALNLNLQDRRLRLALDLARELIGFPRHLGQHPGGFVLTRDALADLVPIEPASMADRQIIEWDKDDIDALKFMKVDVLGLGMLGCLRRAFDLIEEHRGTRLDLFTIPQDDAATYAMIQRADTLGTFQIESRAQMSMLPRMKPKELYDLTIQVAIVRPGPIQGDMVHPYLRRREGLEKPDYPKPELERVLKKTLGVPLFQEQAMQIAIQCAGFTPGEADQLRRLMATFKITGGVHRFYDKLVGGMEANGYSREFAEKTFKQIEGFGSYGFPESHAASFAIIAYASAWVKCHHPDMFCCALLNAQPMGFYAPAQVVRDAREHGVEVRPVDVNHSRWDSTLEPAEGRKLAVRLGLRMAKGLAEADGLAIVLHRGEHPYASVEEISRRAGVPVAALERLAEADAFRSLQAERRDAIWAIRALRDTALPLFAASDAVVEPEIALAPMRPGRSVVEDYGSVGLSLRQHPVAFVRNDLTRQGMIRCADLERLRDGRRVVVPGLVLVRQKPGSAKGVMFITIEDESGIANLIVWPSIFERQRRLVLTASMLAAHGKVQKESGVTHVIVEKLVDLSGLLRQVGERDDPVILPTGRGDEARHGGSPDHRDRPVGKPRDIYCPERLSNGIKVQTRDFR